MTKPRISIIVASAKNGVIGGGNQLLWRISEDLKRFKSLTLGHPIIMGRKTYESIGRPLPERTNIVVTRDSLVALPGTIVCHSLEEALGKASDLDQEEIFIIGGAQIYKQAVPIADRIYLTLVDRDFKGDAYMPDYSDFKKIAHEESRFDEATGLSYKWLDLDRN